MDRRNAFTLIELLIVVAIIAILAAIAVPNFLEAQTRSKISRAKADMRSVATAIEAYRVDCNKYPPTRWEQEGRYAYITTPVAYISSVPMDVFGTGKPGTFVYLGGQLAYYTYDFVVSYAPKDLWGWSNGDTYWADMMKGAMVSGPDSKAWYLASAGPDKRVGLDPQDNPEWMATPYDPTNGSISAGDIHRIGP